MLQANLRLCFLSENNKHKHKTNKQTIIQTNKKTNKQTNKQQTKNKKENTKTHKKKHLGSVYRCVSQKNVKKVSKHVRKDVLFAVMTV